MGQNKSLYAYEVVVLFKDGQLSRPNDRYYKSLIVALKEAFTRFDLMQVQDVFIWSINNKLIRLYKESGEPLRVSLLEIWNKAYDCLSMSPLFIEAKNDNNKIY